MRRHVTALALVVSAILGATAPLASGSPAHAAVDGYQPLPSPQRLLDTRAGQTTVDGRAAGVGRIRAGRTLRLVVAGRGALPDDPGSVVLNVTATGADEQGFVAAFPCDEDRPPTASLNFAADQTIANAVVARVAADGTVCFYARSAVHLVVDAGGFLPGDSFRPLGAPERLVDTRPDGDTVDGEARRTGARPAGSVHQVQIAGRGSLPDDATVAVLNVTVTDPIDRGYLTIFPCDADRPLAANLTYAAGQTIPNAVITRLDPNGRVCVFTRAATHLVIDATGVIPSGVFEPLPAPSRIVDTRPGEVTADRAAEGGGMQPAYGTMQLAVAGRVGIPTDATAVVLNVTSTGSLDRGFVTTHPRGTTRPTAANLSYPGGVNISNLVVAGVGRDGEVCLFTRNPTHLVVDVVGWMTGPMLDTAAGSCPGRDAVDDAEALRTTLVHRAPLMRAVGTDRIAVFVCQVPANASRFGSTERNDLTAGQIANYLDQNVAPYYAEVSSGRYTVDFVAAGGVMLGSDDDAEDCRRGASDRAVGYTGAIGVDNTGSSGGFAGPGFIFTDAGRDRNVFERSAHESARGAWLGGGNVSTRPNPAAFIHELGHMLHWPHSFIGPGSEYDNWVDVMSRGQGWCTAPASTRRYNCDPAHTLAFNRFVAGWMKTGDVVTHDGGTVNYLLAAPVTAGVELLVLPDPAAPLSAMTIEARPAIGHDDFFEREGVAVHVADQYPRTPSPLSGVSTNRRQRQAFGGAQSYEHVLQVGEARSVHGVTIEVLERVGDQFVVRVTGSYRTPGADFFTERSAGYLTHAEDACQPGDHVCLL